MAANVMSNVVSLWYLIAFAGCGSVRLAYLRAGSRLQTGLQSRPDAGVVAARKV